MSNESETDVNFDNLQIYHSPGTLLEENHYYPYGMLIERLSTQASGVNNDYKYQDKELQTHLNYNSQEFALRHYDPAIARWTMHDPVTQFANPYIAMGNNPVGNVDPLGSLSSGAVPVGMNGGYRHFYNGSLGGYAGWQYGGGASAVDADVFGGGGKRNYSIDDMAIYFTSNPMINAAQNINEFNKLPADVKATILESMSLGEIMDAQFEVIPWGQSCSMGGYESPIRFLDYQVIANGNSTWYDAEGNLLNEMTGENYLLREVSVPTHESYTGILGSIDYFLNGGISNGNKFAQNGKWLGKAPAGSDSGILGLIGGSTSVNLAKQIASQAQMAEKGIVIITSNKLKQANRLAQQYGGNASDWVKMSSRSYKAADGISIQTHWYQNLFTRARVEYKTILN